MQVSCRKLTQNALDLILLTEKTNKQKNIKNKPEMTDNRMNRKDLKII